MPLDQTTTTALTALASARSAFRADKNETTADSYARALATACEESDITQREFEVGLDEITQAGFDSGY